MKIAAIRHYIRKVGHRNQLLVAVESDSEFVGWGESGYTSRERSVIGGLAHITPWLIGRDPANREAIFQEIYQGGFFEGGRSMVAAAAAIDIALYDLLGKAWGVPVFDLLGGRSRTHLRCFAHIPEPVDESTVEAAKRAADLGWGALRVQLDHQRAAFGTDVFDPFAAIAAAVRWMPEVRAAVGPGVVVGLHGHHRFSEFEAASLLNQMTSGSIDYVEEPIRNQSVDAYRALRAKTPIPFAIGSEFSSKWEFAPFIESGVCDLVRLDVGLMGLTEAKKVAAIAESRYLDVMPHNPLGAIATAAAAHLAMAIPNHLFLEIRQSPTEQLGFYDAPWLDGVLLPEPNGDLMVPSKPGLGVDLKEDALVAEPEPPDHELPHWKRRDGGWGNW